MRIPAAKLAPTVAMLVSIFVSAIDISIMSTVMPTIVGELGGLTLYSWTSSAYLLTSTTTVPLYGRLADLYGRKPLFLVGTALFVVGSWLCGLATNIEQLIAFRALQGLGAGGMLPITITIAGDLFEGEARARIQGYISGVWGVAAIAGPLVGSLIVTRAAWPWTFWINVPIGIAVAVVLAVSLHEERQRRVVQVDYLGAALLTAGIGSLMLALGDAGRVGLSASHIVVLLGLAGLLLAAFVLVELRTAEPIVPLDLFRDRVLGVTSLGALALGASVYSSSLYLPLFVQGVLGGTPTDVAWVSASLSIAWTCGSITGSQLLVRMGMRSAAVAGMGIVCLGGLALILLGRASPLWVVMAAGAVLGFGLGITSTSFIVVVQTAVAWEQRGVATAMQQFFRSIGGTFWLTVQGAALSATLVARLATDTAGAALPSIDSILEPGLRHNLPPDQVQVLATVLDAGLERVFLLYLALALAGLVMAAFLPARPLSLASAGEPRPTASQPEPTARG